MEKKELTTNQKKVFALILFGIILAYIFFYFKEPCFPWGGLLSAVVGGVPEAAQEERALERLVVDGERVERARREEACAGVHLAQGGAVEEDAVAEA